MRSGIQHSKQLTFNSAIERLFAHDEGLDVWIPSSWTVNITDRYNIVDESGFEKTQKPPYSIRALGDVLYYMFI